MKVHRVQGEARRHRLRVLLAAGMALSAQAVLAAAVVQDIGASAPAPASAPTPTGVTTAPLGGAPAPARADTSSLSLQERVQRLERILGNQALVDMMRRLDEAQLEVQTLRTQFEELANSVEGMKTRQRDLYLDIDRRIQQLESGLRGGAAPTGAVGAPSAGESVPALGAAPAAAASAGGADPAAARAAYERAFAVLREARYEQAITEFERFMAEYGQSEYASNAQYWLGEANYVTRRFERAVTEFRKLIDNYPSSPKVPDAYLKLGFTYYEMGRWADARKALTEVRTKYGTTAAARLAEERLNRMVQEGH